MPGSLAIPRLLTVETMTLAGDTGKRRAKRRERGKVLFLSRLRA